MNKDEFHEFMKDQEKEILKSVKNKKNKQEAIHEWIQKKAKKFNKKWTKKNQKRFKNK
jgi:hypothetical protein